MAWPRGIDVGLLQLQRQAGGHLDLGAHQVDAADGLGDRVLDLQAGVQLQEPPAAVRVEQELDGTRALVSGRRGHRQRRLAQLRAQLAVDGR